MSSLQSKNKKIKYSENVLLCIQELSKALKHHLLIHLCITMIDYKILESLKHFLFCSYLTPLHRSLEVFPLSW